MCRCGKQRALARGSPPMLVFLTMPCVGICSADLARSFLQRADGDVSRALNLYYESDASPADTIPPAAAHDGLRRSGGARSLTAAYVLRARPCAQHLRVCPPGSTATGVPPLNACATARCTHARAVSRAFGGVCLLPNIAAARFDQVWSRRLPLLPVRLTRRPHAPPLFEAHTGAHSRHQRSIH
ncbi:hypothetical protein EON66_10245 [archaeon]|nr:MAG: hypothetical protein EON66_10245 [archaeon]